MFYVYLTTNLFKKGIGASLPVSNPALAITKPPCSSFLICKMGVLDILKHGSGDYHWHSCGSVPG